ncbi:MAG: VOC family protein [Pseudomonadales bacterium]
MKSPFPAVLLLSLCLAGFGSPARADVDLLGRIHFNTQTSDFDRARAFYRLLGYTEGQGDFPRTNTRAMARSLGMYDLCTYRIADIEVMRIPDSWGPTSIDLIQFEVPYNDEPPYAATNHLGMAYAALQTTDLDHDYAYLKERGVNFLSEPYGVPGNRFVFLTDPDGVFYKLEEATPPHIRNEAGGANIVAMPYIGFNVSDYERSLKFYRSLGYTDVRTLPETLSAKEAAAWGFDGPARIKGADVALPGGDRHRLRIIQWLEPFDPEPPYPAPISHIGIHRIALAVADLDAAVATLAHQDVDFLSEVAPCCSGTGLDETGIINAVDPDGIFVELVGPIKQRQPPSNDDDCSDGLPATPADVEIDQGT